jgi:hypothetical protein
MSLVEPYRKVLLVLMRQAPIHNQLDAARALCERLQAGLEIVLLETSRLDKAMLSAQAGCEAAGLFCHLIERPEWRAEDVVAWANSRSCVAALVLAAAERGSTDGAPDPWQHLACPLVLAGREKY